MTTYPIVPPVYIIKHFGLFITPLDIVYSIIFYVVDVLYIYICILICKYCICLYSNTNVVLLCNIDFYIKYNSILICIIANVYRTLLCIHDINNSVILILVIVMVNITSCCLLSQ